MVDVGLIGADEYVFGFGERSGGVRPELATEAALLESAEGGRVTHRRVRVHREVSGLNAAGDPQRATDIAGPERPGEPVHSVVGESDRVGLVVERQHGYNRPEDLLGDDPIGA